MNNVVHAMAADAGTRREAGLKVDAAGFEAAVRPLLAPALRVAYSMLGDRWEAEDAVQEAVTKAWRKLGQHRGATPFRGWFLAIVVNECRNVRRRRWFRTLRLPSMTRTTPDPESGIEHLDLERAFDRLPATDRQALFLYFYLDLPVDEVAAIIGTSPAAAKGRIYRACRRLRPGLQMSLHEGGKDL